MSDVHALLRESRALLAGARLDLDRIQQLAEEPLRGDAGRSAVSGLSAQLPPGPPPPPPDESFVDRNGLGAITLQPQTPERRPRVASEALQEARARRDSRLRSAPQSPRSGLSDAAEEAIDEEESDEDLPSGLNADGAEDQDPADVRAAQSPRSNGSPQASPGRSVAESLEGDTELLLAPAPRVLGRQQSLRTLPPGAGSAGADAAQDPVEAALAPSLAMRDREGKLRKLPARGRLLALPWSGPRTRYVLLRGDRIAYFATPSGRPRRILSLRGARVSAFVTRNRPGGRPDLYTLEVLPSAPTQRALRLITEAEAEARAWMDDLANNVLAAEEAAQLAALAAGASARAEARRSSQTGRDMAEGPQTQTHYDLLGLAPDASAAQVRRAYYALARDFHPDKNPQADERLFASMGRAYAVLKDPQLRGQYDLCETVKAALRLGVLARRHEDGVRVCSRVALFLDAAEENLVWQQAALGSVLREGYSRVETRFIARVVAGEDDRSLRLGRLQDEQAQSEQEEEEEGEEERKRRCLCLHMAQHARKQGYSTVFLELDTREARDDMLDGLRVMRCTSSMLFQQKLDEMLRKGMR